LESRENEIRQLNGKNLDDADEYDSLLEELEKLSARQINNDIMIASK